MSEKEPEEIRREPMSRVDTAWLRMERSTNLMMITGVLMLDEPLHLDKLKRAVKQRFLAYPRFRQKVVDSAVGGAIWEDDADFDLNWHVRLSALPGRAGKRELERFVSQQASTPLDKTKPLWQFHLVEGYNGGSAVIIRIHHCYADGMALMQVILSLTDTSREAKKSTALSKAWLDGDGSKVAHRIGAIDRYVKLGGQVLEKGLDFYRDPGLLNVVAKEGGEIARELAVALSLPDEPDTVLRGRLGVSKRVAWAEPLDLEEVKAVGRAFDCTVNDVLMASVAGALRSYMIDRGEHVDGLTIRATVPVNLRPLEHAKKLGNHFGLVFLELPVGEDNPVRRLERVAEGMCQLKTSRQAIVTYGLLAALGMAPPSVQRTAFDLFSRKATAVATNVPGPQMPLYLAGCPVSALMAWVPQSGSIGLGISILSYNGKVLFGLIGDAKLVPDPDAIIRRFQPEFEKLLYLALMGNWDDIIGADDAEALMSE